jgi:predicted Zn-dependent peptidase
MKHTVEEVKLKCGAKGLLIDIPGTPVFCMEIWFRGGDYYTESRKKMEAAHLMEHLAFGANSKQPNMTEVSRYIKKNGAWFNAHTSRRFLSYEIGAPDFDWERLLKQLVLQVTEPKFLEDEFKAEFGNVQEEMRQRSNDRWGELTSIMGQRFGWDYNETDLERLELMNNVVLEDIKSHYKKVHLASNAVFFIAGDLNGKRVKIRQILEGLGGLPVGKKLSLPEYPEIKSFADNPVVIVKKDVPNIYFAMEVHADTGQENNEQDSISLGVLNGILTNGMHSRIFGKARMAGLIYTLGCEKSFDINGSFSWGIYAQVGVENIDKVLKIIVSEMRDIAENGLSKEEVDEAKLAIKGSLRMSYQTAGGIMGFYQGHYNAREVEEIRYLDDLDGWIDSVTRDSIKKLFDNLIKTKKWGAGFLGNVTEKQAEKWNKKLAEIFED